MKEKVFQIIVEKLGWIFSGINPFFLFLFVFFLGIYVFWVGSSETRKNKSSVFDIFFASSFFGLIVGRIAYIISNLEDFSTTIWYWLPYEKYGEEVFLFRVLPWRFFRIWDWGIDILFMFVGFAILSTIAILLVKKWRWSHMFTTIFFSVETMLALSFFLLGSSAMKESWIFQGLVMFVFPLVLFLLRSSVKKIIIGKKESSMLALLDVFFVVVTTAYVAYTYLSTEITKVEHVGIVAFVVWTAIGILMYILDLKKANVTIEKLSSVRAVSSVDINQPIKLP